MRPCLRLPYLTSFCELTTPLIPIEWPYLVTCQRTVTRNYNPVIRKGIPARMSRKLGSARDKNLSGPSRISAGLISTTRISLDSGAGLLTSFRFYTTSASLILHLTPSSPPFSRAFPLLTVLCSLSSYHDGYFQGNRLTYDPSNMFAINRKKLAEKQIKALSKNIPRLLVSSRRYIFEILSIKVRGSHLHIIQQQTAITFSKNSDLTGKQIT